MTYEELMSCDPDLLAHVALDITVGATDRLAAWETLWARRREIDDRRGTLVRRAMDLDLTHLAFTAGEGPTPAQRVAAMARNSSRGLTFC